MAFAFGLGEEGLDWKTVVARGLGWTSQITKDTLTNAAVVPWANGKTWLAGTTVSSRATMWANTFHDLSYAPSTSSNVNHYPSKFIINLGSKNPDSTFDCPACSKVSPQYKGISDCDFLEFGCTTKEVHASPLPTSMTLTNAPVYEVAAASSAVAGGVAESPMMAEFQNTLFVPGGPYVALSTEGFQQGQDLLNEINTAGEVAPSKVEEAASIQLRSVIDGGYSDNTGIANAVAAGARASSLGLREQDSRHLGLFTTSLREDQRNWMSELA